MIYGCLSITSWQYLRCIYGIYIYILVWLYVCRERCFVNRPGRVSTQSDAFGTEPKPGCV